MTTYHALQILGLTPNDRMTLEQISAKAVDQVGPDELAAELQAARGERLVADQVGGRWVLTDKGRDLYCE